jgi:GNAT superfamily N-acetyltransferase
LTEEEFKPLFEKYNDSMFQDMHSYQLSEILSLPDLEKIETLRLNMKSQYRLYLGVFDQKDEFIGWTWGFQENSETFNMVNSAVLEDHRRQGLYSALLARCIEILTEKGFQVIYSKHCATNNAIIIPKLKAGFVIAKMEMNDRYGILIHLHFYTNSERRRIMDYRSGHMKPDPKIKNIFKI